MNTEEIRSAIKDAFLHSIKDTLTFKTEESQNCRPDIPGLYPVVRYTITWEVPHKFTKYSGKVMGMLMECCREILDEKEKQDNKHEN